MPRANRVVYAGAHYHVTNRGNRKADLFLCASDRRLFLTLTRKAFDAASVRCLAYCLMTNHYHFVLRTDEPRLPEAMQWLEARYAEHFNRAYGLKGHVVQGRYHADLIEDDVYLQQAIRYVLLNPVRAKLCIDAREWLWSSYHATTGMHTHRNWFDRAAVLRLFGMETPQAVAEFASFVAAGDPSQPLANTAQRRKRERFDAAVYAAHATGQYSTRALAQRFGVAPSTINRALNRYNRSA